MNDSRVCCTGSTPRLDRRCGPTGPTLGSSWIESFGTHRASRRPSVYQTRWAPRCVNSSRCGRIIMNDSRCLCTGSSWVSTVDAGQPVRWLSHPGFNHSGLNAHRGARQSTKQGWAPRCVNSSQCGRIIMNDSPTVGPEKARREHRWTSDLAREVQHRWQAAAPRTLVDNPQHRSIHCERPSRHSAAVRASGSSRIDNDGRCQFRR